MAVDNHREEAERLYVTQMLSCQEIAERLGVAPGTVYRWKAEAEKKGDAQSWDTQRRTYNMSPRAMYVIYLESFKQWLVTLQKDPAQFADGKLADAISKHLSSLKKLDPRSQYKGVAVDLIDIANKWLAKNQPALKEQMAPYWESIFRDMETYFTNEGML